MADEMEFLERIAVRTHLHSHILVFNKRQMAEDAHVRYGLYSNSSTYLHLLPRPLTTNVTQLANLPAPECPEALE